MPPSHSGRRDPREPSSSPVSFVGTSERAVHRPVMLREVLAQLELRPGLVVVDGTLGAAGHSREILPRTQPGGLLIGLDRDAMMLRHAAAALAALPSESQSLHRASYSELPRVLAELGRTQVDRVLLDLGLSSDQLADQSRGFGFDAGGPLDLRFDVSNGLPAGQLLQSLAPAELERILQEYGEEPHARAIAAAIVQRRATDPVFTAEQLVAVVQQAVGSRGRGDKHPATRVFQALRIAVNAELEHLQQMLTEVLPRVVSAGGRVVIISFHSLEDRLVKQAFHASPLWQNLTKKPLEAQPAEVRLNPRSRSARLRVAVRTETPAPPPLQVPELHRFDRS